MQKMGWFWVIRAHSRSRAMPPFDRAHTTFYVFIFYRFRDIAGYLSKVADFDPPHLHLAPPQGVIPVEFHGDLWHQSPWAIVWCCLCDPTFSRFSTEQRLVTDGQTDISQPTAQKKIRLRALINTH